MLNLKKANIVNIIINKVNKRLIINNKNTWIIRKKYEVK